MRITIQLLFISVIAMIFSSCGDNGVGPISPADSIWTYLGLGAETVTAIALHPTNFDILYAGSMYDYSAGTVGKLFKSTNAGNTWDTVAIGGGYSQLLIDPQKPETIYGAPGTLIKSTDGGVTWSERDNGIQLDWEHRLQSIAIDPLHSNVLYAGTGGPYGGYFYKSTDAGDSWVRKGDSLADGIISIAIDPNKSDNVYAGTAGRGILWKSTDKGENWKSTGLGETGWMVESICIDQTDSRKLYVGLSPNNWHSIWKSEDGGSTWQTFDRGMPKGSGAMRIVMSKLKQTIFVVSTFSSTSPLPTVDSVGGIYESPADNSGWQKIGIDSVGDYYSSDLAISCDEGYLYFGGKSGIFRLRLK